MNVVLKKNMVVVGLLPRLAFANPFVPHITPLSLSRFLNVFPMRTMSTQRRKPARGPPTKVVLLQDCNLGEKGSVTEVKRGYARNSLVPNKIAAFLSPQNKHLIVPDAKSAAENRNLFANEETQTIRVSSKLSRSFIEFFRQEHKPFEIVQNTLSRIIQKQLRVDIPIERIEISKPINSFGAHQINIHVSDTVVIPFQVDVHPLKSKQGTASTNKR
eukprot:m.14990 g.14990  ORF g.14990 m.14990 type:complete len:216 (-) comp4401_c0_seq1:192-839(-)